jgi:hypothetical protein
VLLIWIRGNVFWMPVASGYSGLTPGKQRANGKVVSPNNTHPEIPLQRLSELRTTKANYCLGWRTWGAALQLRRESWDRRQEVCSVWHLVSSDAYCTSERPSSGLSWSLGRPLWRPYLSKIHVNMWWTCGLVLAPRGTNFYKIPIFGLVVMSKTRFFFNMGS